MNDNKEIKKLNETGEQSAEIVSGGKGVKSLIPEDGMHDSPIPSISYNVYGRYCRDCGKKYSNICMFNGKGYCESCCRKHMKESKNASEKTTAGSESLTESNLSQIAGGTDISTRGFDHDGLSHKPNYHNCQKCGKQFSFIEHEAVRCNGEPPFCAKCKAKQHSIKKQAFKQNF